MKEVMRTITIIMLVLGLTGIVLGIGVGLYRSDRLAKLQEEGKSSGNASSPAWGNSQPTSHASSSLYAFLVFTDIHTLLLAVGTLLTMISTGLFLIGIRKKVE